MNLKIWKLGLIVLFLLKAASHLIQRPILFHSGVTREGSVR